MRVSQRLSADAYQIYLAVFNILGGPVKQAFLSWIITGQVIFLDGGLSIV